jgi:NADP-dependent 3-hydroxy acid dehydrogenase YdfG
MELGDGQVAVVTGAASGIGFSLAKAFRSRGLEVVLADVEAGALTAAANELGGHAVVTDVSRRTDVDALATMVLNRFGRVDVVCNNAGVSLGFRLSWELDQLDWQWVLGVNLLGVIHGVSAFVPHLVRQGSGHVVNTASAAGIGVIAGLAPYDVAKHGVVILSEVLRAELAEHAPGVGVTVVSPGLVRTRIGESARNRPSHLIPPGGPTPTVAPNRSPAAMAVADPDDLAASVLAAVEAGRLHVAFAGAGQAMRARLEQLERDLAATDRNRGDGVAQRHQP